MNIRLTQTDLVSVPTQQYDLINLIKMTQFSELVDPKNPTSPLYPVVPMYTLHQVASGNWQHLCHLIPLDVFFNTRGFIEPL